MLNSDTVQIIWRKTNAVKEKRAVGLHEKRIDRVFQWSSLLVLEDGQLDFHQLSNEEKPQITEDQKEFLAIAIDSAGAGQFNQAETLFNELVKKIPALSIRDLILEYIKYNNEKLD